MTGWPKVWNCGPVSIGLFDYWIGFSWRRLTSTWTTFDLGYLKLMIWWKQ